MSHDQVLAFDDTDFFARPGRPDIDGSSVPQSAILAMAVDGDDWILMRGVADRAAKAFTRKSRHIICLRQ